MKILTGLVATALLAMAALPAYACTPEEAQAKAEEVAETINRLADGNQAKANELHQQLLGLQLRDPTRSDHGACEAYERIIKELEEKAGE